MSAEYAEAPESFAEKRAKAANDPALWSPRDALVNALRMVDNGEASPDRLIVIFREPVEGKSKCYDTSYVHSGHDVHTTIGMLERAKMMLLKV